MRIIYDTGIRLYWLTAWIVSLWNRKARLWIRGRRGWREKLQKVFTEEDQVVWFHCASLGEFEQGRPVIEAYRERCPEHKILLTFFSPSGYEKRKDYPGADHVMYLPLDTAGNARRLVSSVSIEMAFFIKYEFWFHYLRRLKKGGIPVYLASGIFREGQLFFRWYGRWYRRFLDMFAHIFVQQEDSRKLLEKFRINHVTVAGDTRFDRVKKVSETGFSHPALEQFIEGKTVVVAGSTWEPDELILECAYRELPSLKWIIAPHELSGPHIQNLKIRFPESIFFSELEDQSVSGIRAVIVNTIGQLSYLYRYGSIAYVGGGFGRGIHNILEAAVYGMPVIFGPNHRKFCEANELISLGGAFPVLNERELLSTIRQQLEMNSLLKTSSQVASNYVMERVGASVFIVERVCKKSGSQMF